MTNQYADSLKANLEICAAQMSGKRKVCMTKDGSLSFIIGSKTVDRIGRAHGQWIYEFANEWLRETEGPSASIATY